MTSTNTTPAAMPPPRTRRVRRAILLVTSLLAAFLAAEILQWCFLPAPHPLRRRPGPAVFTFHTDGVTLPGISGETRFTTESHGFRYPREIITPKPANVYRVFCVGGSTTECTYLDDEDAWPRRVERKLRERMQTDRIEIINAGFSGMTTADHVEQIEQSLVFFDPDGIVLMAGMNDHLRRRTLHEPQPVSLKRRLMDDSMTVRRAVAFWRRFAGSSGQDGIYQLDPDGGMYRQWRERSRQIPVATGDLMDRLPDPLPTFQKNIERISDTCRRRNIRLVLVTHPSLYRDDLSGEEAALLWMGGVLIVEGRQAPAAWHQRELSRINDWTRAFARARNWPLIDADRELKKSIHSFYDDCHFNTGGAAAMTELAVPVLHSLIRAGEKS